MKKSTIIIPGFLFSGIHAGIKDQPAKKDLALIYSEEPQTLIDGVFTKNRVRAASVDVCRISIRDGFGRLVVINSGIANACTGVQGMKDALKTQTEAAKLFKLKTSQVCVSSTGKIGDFLPMKKVIKGLAKAKQKMGPKKFEEAAKGIMTTDQWPKYSLRKGRLNGKPYTIAVMAKGAGMLRPDMATMLAYVLTDLKFSKPVLRQIFRKAVDQTLNRVTVDGDMSTNDTVLVLANGRAGNKTFSATSTAGKNIEKEMTLLLEEMARKIALDGEGATKCCDVHIKGARSAVDAKKIAYAIGNSPLVKTALFGCDPNWGRIMTAVGYSGANVDQHKISIKIGPYWVAQKGQGLKKTSASRVSKYMKKERIEMFVDCGVGKGTFHVYMSDLTYDYIHLNAEYHT